MLLLKSVMNLQKKDSRVKVFHKKNEGVAVARNFGIQQSNGQYVVIVDSDDVVSW